MWPFGRKRARDAAAGQTGDLGRRGERIARKTLRKHGLEILAENYRCPDGEADLIALDPSTRKESGAETIAFVEVKTRASDRYTAPASAVNADKRRRMKKTADYYLRTHDADGFNVRFDIVSIVIRPGQEPQVQHIPGAF